MGYAPENLCVVRGCKAMGFSEEGLCAHHSNVLDGRLLNPPMSLRERALWAIGDEKTMNAIARAIVLREIEQMSKANQE